MHISFYCLLIFFWAAQAPSPVQAIFPAKISLLGGLSGSVGGDQSGGSGFSRNNNAYGYRYGYGYGRQYFGSGGSIGYGGGYNDGYQNYQKGGDEVVKIIKVIIPNEQQKQPIYAGQYNSNWSPVPVAAPTPVAVPAPISFQYSALLPLPQPLPVSRPLAAPVVQPNPLIVVPPPPPPVVQPLPVPVVQPPFRLTPQPTSQPQQIVKTIQLIINRSDADRNNFAPSSSLQGNYYSAQGSGGLIFKQGGVYENGDC